MNEVTEQNPWGRVDETNTVYVREADSERAVGQFPDGTPEEALAYFVRKFEDLEGQVRLLEQRIVTGAAGSEVAQSVTKLQEQLVAPAAVGDLASLRKRMESLGEKAQALVEKHQAEREQQKREAVEQREAIVAEAERLASQPEGSIRWKETSQTMEQLFTRWQEAQRTGPQISKSQADELWKRFRSARQTFDSARRKFFSQMDATNKEVRERKERLITDAERLASQGSDGIPKYRALLEDWKAAGRASRKLDDQLWARFKAAGDVLYQAKAEQNAKIDEEYSENLVKKEALLTEAEAILQTTDHVQARKQITAIQVRWDEIGRVPRDSLRAIENRLKAIETHVKNLEDDHWAKTNPETIARSEGLKGQLEESIAQLEAEIAEAEKSGDERARADAQQKLETQKSWLNAIDS